MRIERLRASYQIEVRFVHFPLHPETPEEGLTLEQLFAGRNVDIPATNERMVQLMAEEGLPYGDRSMTYNSRLAQELAKWAETQSVTGDVHETLFKAYFVDGVNLAQIDQLIAIAGRLGLAVDEAREVLVTRRFKMPSMPIGNGRVN